MIKLVMAVSENEKRDAWAVLESLYLDFADRVPNCEQYKQKLFSKAKIINAEISGDVQGMIAFYCNNFENKTAFISQIAVEKSSQGKGIGSMLLSKCEELSQKNGMEYLRLEVRNDNINAIDFYQKHGLQFERRASEKSAYMIKSL